VSLVRTVKDQTHLLMRQVNGGGGREANPLALTIPQEVELATQSGQGSSKHGLRAPASSVLHRPTASDEAGRRRQRGGERSS